MSTMASQIAGVWIVYSTVCSCGDQRKHQRSASLAFVRGIDRWPVNSPHKGPVTQKMFPFDDVIMERDWVAKSCDQCALRNSNSLIPSTFLVPIQYIYWRDIGHHFASTCPNTCQWNASQELLQWWLFSWLSSSYLDLCWPDVFSKWSMTSRNILCRFEF